ncbi:hypothetical protein GH714_030220 [Hevea brasiliensis]|uniref:Leucine-rich repeat-containing N-terminal plant-type domain-containing protein n=1 Tax=Hevea brasiliensis TaxID=3981 RepID=A0A6A6MLX8_HEVBR|nr:hypothetical protein GH714_030220 [Hevea brasiliensis]
MPNISSSSFGANLEELVFVENPALVSSLSGIIEEITLSRNQLSGSLPFSLTKLKKLRVLDLSQNHFDGNVPESIGNLCQILKLDLSYNGFMGKIPYSMVNLQSLEFLDLSFNRFGNFGVPLFLGEMPRLREVYLSGIYWEGISQKYGKSLGVFRELDFQTWVWLGDSTFHGGILEKLVLSKA